MILDVKTIEQLKNRNDQTFEWLYHQTNKAIYSMIYSIIKNHQETQDLMQDVYMKMLISIDQYQIGKNFLNWFLQIAKYHTIDLYRKQRKTDIVDVSDMDQMNPSTAHHPDELDAFDRMMDVLDEDERQVILLKVIEDMKHRDIAKVMNKPLGTVLWLYQKALNKLKSGGGAQ